MKYLPLTGLLGTLVIVSCSIKNPKETAQINLGTHLDQKIQVKNDYAKGLNKIKPTKNIEVQKADFLAYATAENFELLLKENRASFVVFGIVNNDYSDFEKKYGIKVKTENCVITPGISQIAMINNLLISNYLNKKFSTEWKSDLKMLPFGLD